MATAAFSQQHAPLATKSSNPLLRRQKSEEEMTAGSRTASPKRRLTTVDEIGIFMA
jgi:hypothetical protein